MAATFRNGEVEVSVPEPMAHNWTNSDVVSLRSGQPGQPGEGLEIIVEKDFQCLHKGEEAKDPDAYPNPEAAPINS
jgi:hypothetical protein